MKIFLSFIVVVEGARSFPPPQKKVLNTSLNAEWRLLNGGLETAVCSLFGCLPYYRIKKDEQL